MKYRKVTFKEAYCASYGIHEDLFCVDLYVRSLKCNKFLKVIIKHTILILNLQLFQTIIFSYLGEVSSVRQFHRQLRECLTACKVHENWLMRIMGVKPSFREIMRISKKLYSMDGSKFRPRGAILNSFDNSVLSQLGLS